MAVGGWIERGQVHTWTWNQLRKGDRFAHEFGVNSEKGTGSHMAVGGWVKRGQVHTWTWNQLRKGGRFAHELREGDRFTHSFGVVAEKGTGSHIGLESSQKREQVHTWVWNQLLKGDRFTHELGEDLPLDNFQQLFFLSRSSNSHQLRLVMQHSGAGQQPVKKSPKYLLF